MTWGYRVMRKQDGLYVIVEAYYEDDGAMMGYTDEAWPSGETVDELQGDLQLMLSAFALPVLAEPVEE